MYASNHVVVYTDALVKSGPAVQSRGCFGGIESMNLLSEIQDIPRYVQIRERLREQISKHVLKPGQKLPSENELAKHYHVSRMTVRRAIACLVDEGLLYRQHGTGTFVAQLRIERDYTRLLSSYEQILRMGLEPGMQILSLEVRPATSKVAQYLALQEGDSVIRFERLRLADGQPVSILCSYVPQKLCPQLLREDLASCQSLFQLLESYGFRLKRAVQKTEIRWADQVQARLLEVKEQAPLIYAERVTFADDGTPVDYVEGWSRADVFSFTVVLSR